MSAPKWTPGWFKRKPRPRPEPSEIEQHRDALRYFIKNQSSIGCYGGAGQLEAAKDAMRFFAYTDLEPVARGEGEGVERD